MIGKGAEMRNFRLAAIGAAIIALVAMLPAWSQTSGLQIVPLGYQQIAGLTTSSAQGLTAPTGATIAVITVSGNAIKYRDDGTAPTTTLGVTLPVTTSGLPFIYQGTLSKIQFISTTGTATLDILYYR